MKVDGVPNFHIKKNHKSIGLKYFVFIVKLQYTYNIEFSSFPIWGKGKAIFK